MSMSNKYDNAMYVPSAKTSLFIHSDFRPPTFLRIGSLDIFDIIREVKGQ